MSESRSANRRPLCGPRGQHLSALLLLALCLWLISSTPLWALGLGEASVKSFLNQPLDVEIPLLDADQQSLDGVSVRLGRDQDYERLGISNVLFAMPMDISLVRNDSGAVIRITSEEPVSEPIVQLVLDVSTGGGRILKEFTFFLDPPSFQLAPPPVRSNPPAAAPAQTPAAPASTPATSSSASEQQAPASAPAPVLDPGAEYGPVQSGDTLWRISRNFTQGSGYSINQAMVAIVRLNPQAFGNGDINQLRRGAILRLPDNNQLDEVTRSEADQLVQEQMQRWRSQQSSDVTPTLSQATRTQTETPRPATPAPEPESRLELVPPSEGQQGSGSGSGQDESDAIAGLQERLARAQEDLVNANQENDDLRNLVTELEAQLERVRSGLSIEDSGLAALEERIAEQEAAEAAAEEDTASLDALASSTLDSVDGADQPADNSASVTGAADSNPASSAEGTEAVASPAEPAARPERRQQAPWWQAWWLWLGAGVLVVVAGIIFMVRRQQGGWENVEDDSLSAALIGGDEPRTGKTVDTAPAVPARAVDPATQGKDVDMRELTEDAEGLLRVLEAEAEEDSGYESDSDEGEIDDEVELDDGTSARSVPYDEATVREFLRASQRGEAHDDTDEDIGHLLDEVRVENPSGPLGKDLLDENDDDDAPVLMPPGQAPSQRTPREEAPADLEEADDALAGEDDTALEDDDHQAATPLDDPMEVKLDLARAYLSMEDPDSARQILVEVVEGGNDDQRQEASDMLAEL